MKIDWVNGHFHRFLLAPRMVIIANWSEKEDYRQEERRIVLFILFLNRDIELNVSRWCGKSCDVAWESRCDFMGEYSTLSLIWAWCHRALIESHMWARRSASMGTFRKSSTLRAKNWCLTKVALVYVVSEDCNQELWARGNEAAESLEDQLCAWCGGFDPVSTDYRSPWRLWSGMDSQNPSDMKS